MYRHGDILLVKADKKNISIDGLKKRPNKIIEYGEATGHKHQIEGQCNIYENSEGQATILIIEEKSKIVHEEHHPIELLPDTYQIIRQREYNPYLDAIRYVQD